MHGIAVMFALTIFKAHLN